MTSDMPTSEESYSIYEPLADALSDLISEMEDATDVLASRQAEGKLKSLLVENTEHILAALRSAAKQ